MSEDQVLEFLKKHNINPFLLTRSVTRSFCGDSWEDAVPNISVIGKIIEAARSENETQKVQN